jgi:hypothetical protein
MIDEPEENHAPERGSSPAPRRRAQRASANSRPDLRPEKQQRDFDDDYAGYSAPPSNSPDEDFYPSRRAGGVRVRLSGSLVRLPRTLWGRIVGGLLLLAFFACIAGALLFARNFFQHDERFVLQSTASIEIVGNTHSSTSSATTSSATSSASHSQTAAASSKRSPGSSARRSCACFPITFASRSPSALP